MWTIKHVCDPSFAYFLVSKDDQLWYRVCSCRVLLCENFLGAKHSLPVSSICWVPAVPQLWDQAVLCVWLSCACAGHAAGFPVGGGWEKALMMAVWSESSSESWCPPHLMRSRESSAAPRPSRNLPLWPGGWASLPSQGGTLVSPWLPPQGHREGISCQLLGKKKASVNRRIHPEARLGAEQQLQAEELFLPSLVGVFSVTYTLPLSMSSFDCWEIILSLEHGDMWWGRRRQQNLQELMLLSLPAPFAVCGKTGLSEGSSELDVAAVNYLLAELISAGILGHINLTSLKLAFIRDMGLWGSHKAFPAKAQR